MFGLICNQLQLLDMQTSQVNTPAAMARKRRRADYKIGQKPKPTITWAALSLINVRKHSHRWDIITCSALASFGKSNKNRRPALQFPCARTIFILRLCEIENLLKVCVRGDERESGILQVGMRPTADGVHSIFHARAIYSAACVYQNLHLESLFSHNDGGRAALKGAAGINMYRISANDVSVGVYVCE
jgi:hypothetical protein